MLYRLLKNVNQSLSTPFSLSGRSSHSGLQSSAFSEDWARAREASFPANTVVGNHTVAHQLQDPVTRIALEGGGHFGGGICGNFHVPL